MERKDTIMYYFSQVLIDFRAPLLARPGSDSGGFLQQIEIMSL